MLLERFFSAFTFFQIHCVPCCVFSCIRLFIPKCISYFYYSVIRQHKNWVSFRAVVVFFLGFFNISWILHAVMYFPFVLIFFFVDISFCFTILYIANENICFTIYLSRHSWFACCFVVVARWDFVVIVFFMSLFL